ncbi:flagellar basal body L-ring protein FlgH [Buchnera aphidicola]|uniref:Flagellar L-ring protein n=1 Tax=Buchnera aphidicola str. USDA (Myzus persicae) TaxID=1009856 RepID=W0NZY6_BUCMP|nr:flagellar basal body L-ring protein FlgH [Buchnera aphidicola]AHG60044.1 Flgh [Buchnera aphidicola str. USDA (Myzus persicae)]AHG60624.1 Flgh [Buchnera aphidicola str. W106 (Myzus persicae)]AHG61196.1 Flgh [Buchnera aphidicola str. G002 (Myzus persicae)]AHG61769.1 Flgh [Buchnera aphidicola str. F009 (Myzus persicae)]WAI03271.1 MAG: flagellar basal body L-ring protein FlgH [Buchnera aphidicola (Myzus persicae)]
MIKLFICQFKYYLTALFLLTIQSCASVPYQPLVEGVTTAVAPNILPKIVNGSLFQERTPINPGYQPLFEDHRPHNIGDTITVVLQENISASNSSASNMSRDGSANLGITIAPSQFNPILGFDSKDNKTGLDSIGKNVFSGTGSNSAENKFTGLITVTVKQVLPNGNLKVVGEKQVAINEGTEFIRFSGVINPNNISKNNLVASTQISDTRIEYLNNGRIHDIQKMGWLQRFLLKISPI